MRELTVYELDAQLAEQLPARELMAQIVVVHSFNDVGNGAGNHSGGGSTVIIQIGNYNSLY